jgi:hypothetical protein
MPLDLGHEQGQPWKKPTEEPPRGTSSNILEDEEPHEEPCPCRLLHRWGGMHGTTSRDPRLRSVAQKVFRQQLGTLCPLGFPTDILTSKSLAR